MCISCHFRSIFLCDRWLAVEEDDGMVDRIIPVAGLDDLVNFKHLFSSSARKKLTNEHLWLSVFSRPTRSNFTRVQRISCCMSLLFLTMITNCMWFKTEGNQGNVTSVKFGPFRFTLQQVFISLASTMIVFPVSFLMVTLFRRCRQKSNNIMQMNQIIPKRGQKYRWKKNTSETSTIWANDRTKAEKLKESIQKILTFQKHDKFDEDRQGVTDIKKRKKKPATLPHWCIYIGYVRKSSHFFVEFFCRLSHVDSDANVKILSCL